MSGVTNMMPWWDSAEASVFTAALLLAFVIDHVLGEPPTAWHPVVWMGRYLERVGKLFAPAGGAGMNYSRACVFAWGAFYWCVGASVVVIAAVVLETCL